MAEHLVRIEQRHRPTAREGGTVGKVAVFIDHDIVIRHFVLNDALSSIQKEHETVFVFPENNKRVRIDLQTLGLHRIRTIPVSTMRTFLYRRLYHATVLRKMRRTQRRHRRATMRIWRYLLGPIPYWKSWFCSWPLTYELYRWWILRKIGPNDRLDELLREERPDIIVHPTVLEGLFVSDLVRWGEANGKPTIFIMNSWDNPATKAMLVGQPSCLVVWGEQTRDHAIRHMGASPERIVSLGSAQFDLYRNPPRETPADYRRRLGIPLGHKVLLYAGSSNGLNETSHLIQLEEAIERGELKNCVVLYRPHPWRAYPPGEQDYYSLEWKHVTLDPAMESCYRQSRKRERIHVELANYENTHVILSAVDAVISPLSTILLEAAMHGKPVAAYLPDDGAKKNQSVTTRAQMIHFMEFFERVDCVKCESPDALIEDCRHLLQKADEPGIGERLTKQCAYFVAPSSRPYADGLKDLVRTMLPPGEA